MSDKVHNMGSGEWAFQCPGCEHGHAFRVVSDGSRPNWTFSGDVERPTFRPSLDVNRDYPASRCHSFVTDGRIQFLSDCHHALAGQTVDLPDWDE